MTTEGKRDSVPRRAGRDAAARYTVLLDSFGAATRRPIDCVHYLESQGLTHGQARNAVYRYRRQRMLGLSRAGRSGNSKGAAGDQSSAD